MRRWIVLVVALSFPLGAVGCAGIADWFAPKENKVYIGPGLDGVKGTDDDVYGTYQGKSDAQRAADAISAGASGLGIGWVGTVAQGIVMLGTVLATRKD